MSDVEEKKASVAAFEVAVLDVLIDTGRVRTVREGTRPASADTVDAWLASGWVIVDVTDGERADDRVQVYLRKPPSPWSSCLLDVFVESGDVRGVRAARTRPASTDRLNSWLGEGWVLASFSAI